MSARVSSFCSGPFHYLLLVSNSPLFEERLFLSALQEVELVGASATGEAGNNPVALDNVSAVHLVQATPADDAFMYATFASTRTEELAITGWSEEQKEHFLRMQFEAQRSSYLRDLPEAVYSVIYSGATAVGRLIVERTATEIHIVDIALQTQFRKLGIGSVLMGRMFDEAKQTGKSVRLFVEKFNPALHWYERMGFKVLSTAPIYLEMVWRPAAVGLTP
jgi:ribosomal protein S18 acetylase RimI-like enzyme